MNPRPASHAVRNEKVYRSLSYVLVFLMMACIIMTIGNLIGALSPTSPAGTIAGLLLFIVIDRLYTHQQLKTLTPLSREWMITLGTQWIVIVLFSRFLLSSADGPDSLMADLSLLARGYIADLVTVEFMITLFLAMAAWAVAAQFLELLDEIGLDMKIALQENRAIVPSGTVPAHERMVNLILSTGIVVVILSVLTRLNVRMMLSNTDGFPRVELSRFSGTEAGALLYFVFGLALLSLSKLMTLQTHWNYLRIPVSSQDLPGRWALYSLLFLLILAVFISLLPAGDSLGLFSILQTLFVYLFGVLVFVARLVVMLILFLFSLPFLLFGMTPPIIAPSSPPPMLVMPPVEPTSSAPNPLWELIRSIILWGSLLAVVVYAFIQFVKQHEDILNALRRSRVTNWLVLAWQWLYRNVDKTRGYLSRAIADGWQSMFPRLAGRRILPRPYLLRPRSLDARRRVFFFYLAMIRRGGEQGLARRPSQTPSEYAVHLEEAVPSASDDIDSLTESFVRARYSRQEIDSQRADHARATWERIRHALQSKANREKSANQ
jgi:hypothetical protein